MRAWQEDTQAIGFVTSEAVEFAAQWFEQRPTKEAWYVGDCLVTKVLGPDGECFVDPSTGEVCDGLRPVHDLIAVDRVTGRELDAHPALFGPGRWVDPVTGRHVDGRQVGIRHRNEKLAGGMDCRLVITPGSVGLRVTDPRDSSDLLIEEYETVINPDGTVSIVQRPKRGKVSEFSRSSQMNLIRRTAAIPWGDLIGEDERLWMFTLTAPGGGPDEWREWLGRHDLALKAMKSFEDRLRNSGCPPRYVWKREFQERGAPHWHLIVVAPMLIDGRPVREWVSQAWFEAVGSGQESHLLAGTRCDLTASLDCSDAKRMALYFAAYAMDGEGKGNQHVLPYGYADANGSTGRWWGMVGIKSLEIEVRVTEAELVEAKRLFRVMQGSKRGTDDDGRSVPLTKVVEVNRVRRPLDRSGPKPEYGPDRPPRKRRVRRRHRVQSFVGTIAGCTALVNDGPAFAVAIARYLALSDGEPWPRGQVRPLP